MTTTRTKQQAFELIAAKVQEITGDDCSADFVRTVWDRFTSGQKPPMATRNEKLVYDKIQVSNGLIKSLPDIQAVES